MKKNYDNYYDKVNALISGIGKDNLLLIGSKEDELHFNEVTTEHFGNFIGKNTWRDFNKIVLTHNFQTPFFVYALKYIYFSNKKIYNNADWDMQWDTVRSSENGAVVFKNEDIESIRVTELVGHLYQAIKRINRDNKLSAQVYIFNSDESVLKILKRQFKGITIQLDTNKLQIQRRESPKGEKMILSNHYEIVSINLLKEIKRGKFKDYEITPNTYSKSWFMDEIGFNDRTHFSREILLKGEVYTFLKENGIETRGKFIKFTKPIVRWLTSEEEFKYNISQINRGENIRGQQNTAG